MIGDTDVTRTLCLHPGKNWCPQFLPTLIETVCLVRGFAWEPYFYFKRVMFWPFTWVQNFFVRMFWWCFSAWRSFSSNTRAHSVISKTLARLAHAGLKHVNVLPGCGTTFRLLQVQTFSATRRGKLVICCRIAAGAIAARQKTKTKKQVTKCALLKTCDQATTIQKFARRRAPVGFDFSRIPCQDHTHARANGQAKPKYRGFKRLTPAKKKATKTKPKEPAKQIQWCKQKGNKHKLKISHLSSMIDSGSRFIHPCHRHSSPSHRTKHRRYSYA